MIKSQPHWMALAFEGALDAILVSDHKGAIIAANAAACRLTGYKEEEMLLMRIKSLVPETDFEKVELDFVELRLIGQVHNEGALKRKDGSIRTVEYTCTRIGEGLYMSILRDVTERKQLEEALRRSKERYRDLFENANDIIYTHDLQGNFTSINNAARNILGYTLEEAVFMNISQIVAPEYLELVRSKILEKLDGKWASAPYEIQVISKDGRRVWLEVSTRLIFEGGRSVEVQGIARDITERKRAEGALQESALRFRKIFEDAPIGMAIVGPDYRLIKVNKALCHMLGYAEDELIELTFANITHPDDVENDLHLAEQVFRGEITSYKLEKRYIKKNQEILWADLTATVIRDQDGNMLYGLGMVENITERKRAEQELKASEQQLKASLAFQKQLIASLSVISFITTDLNAIVTSFSPGAENIFGYKAEEMIGQPVAKLHLPEDVARFPEIIQAQIEGRVGYSGEITLVRKNGEQFPAEFSTYPVMDADGKVICLLGVSRDITARKRTEQELLERNKELEVLNQVNRLLASSLDVRQALCQAVKVFQQGFGYLVCSVFLVNDGKDTISLVASSGYQLPEEFYSRKIGADGLLGFVAAAGEPLYIPDVSKEARYIEADERVRSECLFPLKMGERVIGVLNVASDRVGGFSDRALNRISSFAAQVSIALTNEQLYRQAIEARDKFLDLYNNAPDGYHSVAPDGTILEMNNTELERLGYRREEVVGKLKITDLLPPEALDGFPEFMQKLIERGEMTATIEQRRKDGSRIPVRLHTKVIYDDLGQVAAFRSAVRDITRERALQAQLMQAEKMSAVGQLISGVAHELNNPLTGVLGFAQLLLMDESLSSSARQYLQCIVDQGMRARGIVQNLLTFARQHKPEKAMVDINKALRSTLALRSYELKVNNIEVIEELSPSLPQTLADFQQLQQVFLNIIINAEQAMLEARDRGKLTIKTLSGDGWITICFTDDGPGIKAKDLPRIFEPFFTTKEVGKGTGLGLSICYGIIEEHGGKIYAISEEGKGASFIVELPVVTTTVAPDKEDKNPLPPVPGRKRILAVDDEHQILELLSAILTRLGHEVEVASSVEEAIDLVKKIHFDAIISDFRMPESGGQEFYQELNSLGQGGPGQLIFITGDAVNETTTEFFRRAGCKHLIKPFTITQVEQTLAEVLGINQ